MMMYNLIFFHSTYPNRSFIFFMLLKIITNLVCEVEVIVAGLVKEQLAGSYAVNAPVNYKLKFKQPKAFLL